MKTSIGRGLLLALALALVAGPLLSTTADARPDRGRERPRIGAPNRPGRGWGSVRQERRGNREHRFDRREHREYRFDRREHREYRFDRRHHRGSGVGPFLGGLAIGAIIGGHAHDYCPPPPPPPVVRRIYVYDCPWCPARIYDYNDWVEHLMDIHGVPGFQIDECYPPYARGHWEAY